MKFSRVFFAFNLALWFWVSVAHAGPVYNNNKASVAYQQGVTTEWTKVLDPSSIRRYLLIVNKGSQTVYLNFDEAGSTPTSGIPLAAGASYEPVSAPMNSVYAISSVTAQALLVIQGR